MDKKLFNVYQLKIIAIISMAIDHTAIMLGSTFMLYEPMRAIGRIAFPVFAFLLANGWNKTGSKTAYISRIMIFAAISALPHTLLLGTQSSVDFVKNGLAFSVVCMFVFVCFMLFFAENADRHKSLFVVFSVPCFFIPFFTGRRNVLYTFLYAMLFMLFVERMAESVKMSDKNNPSVLSAVFHSVLKKKNIMILPLLLFPQFMVGEYEFSGVMLIVLMCIAESLNLNRLNGIVIIFWAVNEYILKIDSPVYLIFAVFAALLCALYNGEKGSGNKYAFYIFYPLHLLVLGIIRVFCF